MEMILGLSKAINKLQLDITSKPTLDEAKEHLLLVLNSYSFQVGAGLDKIESFVNSVYTPSKRSLDGFNFKKNKTFQKRQVATRYEHLIKEWRQENISDEKIAILLNSRYIHKKDYFNKVYIYRFRKERGIN
jgi:hypothetical protein